ncbi:hypothetical protein BDY19DRAFT_902751 [Irpex rosettiformis]|uniref:Uncharacterized protein n=1 Tax=Irpex rosettiformis TaxID=378272 RepID=A0ACB8UJ27_9APHY|nr:hypothetical protein BDY19DRAFT_902751 [Irpex rosettiformis]
MFREIGGVLRNGSWEDAYDVSLVMIATSAAPIVNGQPNGPQGAMQHPRLLHTSHHFLKLRVPIPSLPRRRQSLSGLHPRQSQSVEMKPELSPTSIVFVAIALGAMCIAVVTALYFSLIAPRIARPRKQEAERAVIDQTPPSSYSPYLDNDPDRLSTPPLAQEKSMYAEMFVKEGDSREMSLSPPMPAYAADKRGRFSTATQDGIWWVV